MINDSLSILDTTNLSFILNYIDSKDLKEVKVLKARGPREGI